MKQRTDYSRAFGASLREQMKVAGVGSMQAGVALGLSQMSVLRHMKGDAMPNPEQIRRYADLLGCSTDQLLPRLDSNQQPVGPGIADELLRAAS